MRRSKIPKSISIKEHHFRQTYVPSTTGLSHQGGGAYTINGQTGILTSPAATQAVGQFTIRYIMSDLPQFASLSTLFDSYRINKVVTKFVPLYSAYQVAIASAAGPLAPNSIPADLTTVIDYDDANYLTDLHAALEYDTCKITKPWQNQERVFTPKLSELAYKVGGLSNSYVQKTKQWIDFSDAGNTEHYGLKGILDTVGGVNDVQVAFNVYVTMYFSTRQVR